MGITVVDRPVVSLTEQREIIPHHRQTLLDLALASPNRYSLRTHRSYRCECLAENRENL